MGAVVPMQVVVGFAVLMPALNLLLVAGLFTRAVPAALVVMAGGAWWRDCIAVLSQTLERLKALGRRPLEGRVRVAVLTLVAVTFVCGLVGLAAPCTAYDSTVYHLTLPKLYAAEEGFAPRADIVQSRYPQNLAGVRTFAWQWGGEDAVEFLNWMTCVLLAWLLVELAVRARLPRSLRYAAPVILCASPQFVLCLYDADVEGWVALFVLALFAGSLGVGDDSRPALPFPLCGLLGGCVVGIKLPALPVAGLLLLLHFVRLCKADGRVPWRGAAAAAALAGGMGLFWHAVLFIVYADAYSGSILGMGISLLSPGRLQVHRVWQAARSLAMYNPPLVVLAAVVSARSRRDRLGREILLVVAAISIAVLVTNPWSGCFARYTFYLTPLLVFGALKAFPAQWSATRIGRRAAWYLAGVLLCGSLAVAQVGNLYRCARRIPVVLGAQAQEEYLRERVPHYDAIVAANAAVPAEGRLFMAAERSYWLEVPYVLGIERNPKLRYADMTPAHFFALLEEWGITHLLYSDDPLDHTREFRAFWEDTLGATGQSRLVPLSVEGLYALEDEID